MKLTAVAPFRRGPDKEAAFAYAKRNKTLFGLGFRDYPDYLESDLWKSIRQTVMNRDGHKCTICKQEANQVHHTSYGKAVLQGTDLKSLISICRECHEFAEYDGARKCGPSEANKRLLERKTGIQQRYLSKKQKRKAAKKPGMCLCGNMARRGDKFCGPCAIQNLPDKRSPQQKFLDRLTTRDGMEKMTLISKPKLIKFINAYLEIKASLTRAVS